jgi:hypothetical protein
MILFPIPVCVLPLQFIKNRSLIFYERVLSDNVEKLCIGIKKMAILKIAEGHNYN